MNRLLFKALFAAWCVLFAGSASAQQQVRLCLQEASSPNSCIPYGASGALTTTNGSIKIATGLTYQTLLAAAATRNSLTIQNNQASGTDICYVIVGTNQITSASTTTSTNITIAGNTVTAAQASIVLSPGQAYTRYYPFVPSDTIYVTCTTTADSVYVDTQ